MSRLEAIALPDWICYLSRRMEETCPASPEVFMLNIYEEQMDIIYVTIKTGYIMKISKLKRP
jgi:hypothetical protein